ncbi:MAG TPA: MarR family transcriptional regulator, partial [Ilumatobacteraceae bacterium]|nr:MarR family transcriptional regulator [Ilumatobacteraceae bacterium]
MDSRGQTLDRSQLALSRRIGAAWVGLRRGATMSALRDYLFGDGEDALEQGQMDALELLAARPAWRMSNLAEALRVDPSTATRAVQRLEANGLAERRPNPDDGRVVEVTMTAEGRKRHREASQRGNQLMAHILDSFGAQEAVVLADFMERLIGSIDEFVAQIEK